MPFARLCRNRPPSRTALARTALTCLFAAALTATTACAPRVAREDSPSDRSRGADASIVLLISIDGMPADLLGTGAMPTLDGLATDGVRASWMTPSYPTLTFPNHYTLVTGLRPDHHGIVHNNMTDATLGRYVSKDDSAKDGRWWGGEPIWATLQKQGGIAATMFWPGSEARIAGEEPRYRRAFDMRVPPEERADQILAWLDLPPQRRPQLLTLYFEQYDVASHLDGGRSERAMGALRRIDDAIARVRDGLRERGLLARTELIVVSDHGMADVPLEQRVWLEDLLDPTLYETEWWGTMLGLRPNPGQRETVERAFLGAHPHFDCWTRETLPAAWRFGTNARIPPIVCQVRTGWRVQSRKHQIYDQPVKGEHGFGMDDPTMRAVFVAAGPAFCRGAGLPAFDNVDLYPLLARLLRVTPAPNDGTDATFATVLRAARTDGRGARNDCSPATLR